MVGAAAEKMLRYLRLYGDDPESMDSGERQALEETVDYSTFESLSTSDMAIETVAEILAGFRAASSRRLNEAELRALIESIRHEKVTEAQRVLDVITFDANCKHPEKNGLIFYPVEVFGSDNPTTDDILARALNG